MEVTAKIQIGAFDAEPQPFMGAVVSARAASRLMSAQERLLARGAKALLKMEQRNPQLGFVTPAGRPRRQPAGWREAFQTILPAKDPT